MPDPKEKTLVITLTFQEALVFFSALCGVIQDLQNTSPFRIRATVLAQKLLQRIIDRWPHVDADDIVALFQDLKHHQAPH